MRFDFDISIISYILMSLMSVSAIVYAAWQLRRTSRVKKFLKTDEVEREYLNEDQLPGISVIVYSCNEAQNLTQLLPMILNQNYPAFEVIVTDDSSSDSTKEVLSEMLTNYKNLRVSFVPSGTRSLSRKKLSIMLGIKAAKYDIILTTTANTRVMHEDWLRLMGRNFVDGVDVVIGYGHYRYQRDKKFGRRYRVFDTVETGMQFLSSAIKGRPYRGVCENLAYRKDLFFAKNGFAGSLDLRWGEDDVFVSEIADSENTRVELLPDSQVCTYYDNYRRAHRELSLRREFTSRLVSTRKPFVVQASMTTLLYVAAMTSIAVIIQNYRNIAVISTVAAVILSLFLIMSISVCRQCRLLGAPRLFLTVPFLGLWRPWVKLKTHIRCVANKRLHYTSITD